MNLLPVAQDVLTETFIRSESHFVLKTLKSGGQYKNISTYGFGHTMIMKAWKDMLVK